MEFRKSERRKAKLRLGITGPAGSGKTYGALLIAKGLGGKVAMIDTENGSGDLYAALFDYDIGQIQAPYTVQKYLSAIHDAENAGYDVIIIDSLSHVWAGEGGLLDMQGKITDSSKSGNSWAAWRHVTPLHNMLINVILNSKSHIIATMRSKTEYILVENEKGLKEPKKIGLAPVQREGMDYEFGVVFDLGVNHMATVSKDRTSLFDGQVFMLSEQTGQTLKTWLETGIDLGERKKQIRRIWNSYLAKYNNDSNLANAAIKRIIGDKSANMLSQDDIEALLKGGEKSEVA